MTCRNGLAATAAALLCGTTRTLAAQGVAVGDGTAGPIEQAVAIAFILALPLTLLAIGLSRPR